MAQIVARGGPFFFYGFHQAQLFNKSRVLKVDAIKNSDEQGQYNLVIQLLGNDVKPLN